MSAALVAALVFHGGPAGDHRARSSETDAIAGFRRIHVMAILSNVVLLVLIVWSLLALSAQMS